MIPLAVLLPRFDAPCFRASLRWVALVRTFILTPLSRVKPLVKMTGWLKGLTVSLRHVGV